MLRLTASQANQLLNKAAQPKRPAVPRLHSYLQPDGCLIEPGYLVLVLPVPPSKNADPANPFARQAQHDSWAEAAYGAWLVAGLVRMEQVEISPVFYHKLERKRDMDNVIGNAMKGILDGLKGHLVQDDNAKLLTLHAAELRIDKGCPRLELHIKEMKTGGDER